MKLKCVRAFGNFVPGDVVEVPDGAKFDDYYFVAVPVVAEPKPAPVKPEGGVK